MVLDQHGHGMEFVQQSRARCTYLWSLKGRRLVGSWHRAGVPGWPLASILGLMAGPNIHPTLVACPMIPCSGE